MDDETLRARRRLRQQSDRVAPEHATEIITLDASSDEFVPRSNDQRDASDTEVDLQARQRQANDLAPKKRRGLKRLRRGDADSDCGGFVSSHPHTVGPVPEPVNEVEEWKCTRCTYLNASTRLACEICLTARSTPRQTRKLSAWLTTTPTMPMPKQKTKHRGAAESVPTETIDSSDEDMSSVHLGAEKAERKRASKPATPKSTLWSEASQAQQIDELCVQKKKVQEVQAWLQQSVPSPIPPHHHVAKRLLFLCGPPGSGKSTTVRHLAMAMGLTIKEWRDNSSAGKLQYHRFMRDEFRIIQTSAWDDFIDFINCSVNYSSLPVAAYPDKQSRKRLLTQTRSSQSVHATQGQGQLILLESWPQNPLGSNQDSAMWDEKLTSAFRQIVNSAANLQYPVVCIFSDVRDKKVDANQLAKIFSDDVVRSSFTSIINFNPVTAAQMKKTLARSLERLHYTVSSQDIVKIIERSDGDMRHAMNMAQLTHNRHTLAPRKRPHAKAQKSTLAKLDACSLGDIESEELSRDPFVSDFHILGKLLHSKNMKPNTSQSSASESRLVDFDRILDLSVMPLDRLLSLLLSNCTEYFTEIEHLDNALSLMSLSETWLHDSYRTTSSSAAFKLSHEIVRAVVVRSIALTNEHPAPSAFRPITAPRTYETSRRMFAGREDSLVQQHKMTGGNNSTYPYRCRGDVYAFEMQPFVDIMGVHRETWSSSRNGERILYHEGQQGATGDVVVDDEIENSDDGEW